MNNADCKPYDFPICQSVLCANNIQKKSPTFGDSGGPIVLKNSDPKNPIQVGVYSIGGEPGKPVIYTRITSYISWIEQVTGSIFNNNAN